MRKLLFVAITLLALLLAAEVGVTLLSQYGMERALRSQYDLPPNLEVNINSFPYLLSLGRNHLGELQLDWEGEVEYSVEEGALESMLYTCRVNLYDVELKMASLLTGKLEIRDISRLKAVIGIDLSDLNQALALPGGGFFVEDGRLYAAVEGKKTQYKVKASGENTLAIEPADSSSGTTGSQADLDVTVETVELSGLPMDCELDAARMDGERIMIEISIPSWEGYLQSHEFYLQ